MAIELGRPLLQERRARRSLQGEPFDLDQRGASGNRQGQVADERLSFCVILNRNLNASGSVGGNGGDVTVIASSGAATTLSIITRGGTTAGDGGMEL